MYPAKCQAAAAVMLMIMNNLDDDVAQFPEELVTYGGNGQVFSNWAQVFDRFLIAHNRSSIKHTVLVDDEIFVRYDRRANSGDVLWSSDGSLSQLSSFTACCFDQWNGMSHFF